MGTTRTVPSESNLGVLIDFMTLASLPVKGVGIYYRVNDFSIGRRYMGGVLLVYEALVIVFPHSHYERRQLLVPHLLLASTM